VVAASSLEWCDAAESLRVVVERLALPGHVAGYLRGYADALEFHCSLGAPVDTSRGDIVSVNSGHLAGYLRGPAVSSEPTIEQQRARIEAAARRGRFTVVSWHEDEAGHATNLRNGGLQEARSAIAGGAAGGIVVAEAARLGRNSLDVLDLVELARTEGWRLVALDCRFDSATPAGELVAEGLAAARGLEWRKVKRPAPRRRWPAHSGTGSRANGTVDPQVAERIGRMRAEGESYRAIAGALNDEGVAGAPDGTWRASTIRSVLLAGRDESLRNRR
jgi:DNA invertase Pin-like site-specific DNA recombinase